MRSVSRRTRVIVWICLILGSIEVLGAFLYSVAGAGIYGSPFGKGAMPIEQEGGIVLLILTGPICLFAAGLTGMFGRYKVASHILWVSAMLCLLACWRLSWALLWESGFWWEYALGFSAAYFVGLGSVFPLPMLVLGKALHREYQEPPWFGQRTRYWMKTGICFSLILYFCLRFVGPVKQQLAIHQIEKWGGTVLIIRERAFPDSIRFDSINYHKPPITEQAHVDLSGTNIDDSDLATLDSLGVITFLNLSDTLVGDRAMSLVSAHRILETLDLTNTKVTDLGLQHLTGLSNLQYLTLYGTATTQKGRGLLQDSLRNCMISPLDQPPVRPQQSFADWRTHYLVEVREQPQDGQEGKMVKGANVVFKNDKTETAEAPTEIRNGYHSFELPVGQYRLSVTCEGYSPYFHEKPVKVNVRRGRVHIDVMLVPSPIEDVDAVADPNRQ